MTTRHARSGWDRTAERSAGRPRPGHRLGRFTRAGLGAVALTVLALPASCSSDGDIRIADGSTTTGPGSTVAPGGGSTVAPTTAAPPTEPPTTAPPAPTAPTWDQIKNASIPSMCGHPPTTLVDGKNVSLGETEGAFELLPTLYSGSPGILQGVPSPDAGPLTAVVVSCNAGGVGWPNQIAFFSDGGGFYGFSDLYEGVDWESKGMSEPAREGVNSITLEGDELVVFTDALTYEDAACCPSTAAVLRLRVANGTAVVTSLEEDIGD